MNLAARMGLKPDQGIVDIIFYIFVILMLLSLLQGLF